MVAMILDPDKVDCNCNVGVGLSVIKGRNCQYHRLHCPARKWWNEARKDESLVNKDDRALIDANTKAIMELSDVMRNHHKVMTGAMAEQHGVLKEGFAALVKQQEALHMERNQWRLEDLGNQVDRNRKVGSQLLFYTVTRIVVDGIAAGGILYIITKLIG